jgi:hypothetical protein
MPPKPRWKQLYEEARDCSEDLHEAIGRLKADKRDMERKWPTVRGLQRKLVTADMVALKDAIAFAEEELTKHERRIFSLCTKRLSETVTELQKAGAGPGPIVIALANASVAAAKVDKEVSVLLLGHAVSTLLESRNEIRRARSKQTS